MNTHLIKIIQSCFSLLTSIGLLLSLPSSAQTCADGNNARTLTYDSMTIGNGNGSRSIVFPKFDPSLGILTAVKLNTDVSMEYSYSLKNLTPSTKTYKVRILRTDDVSNDEMLPGSINVTTQDNAVTATLAAGAVINVGPRNMHYTTGYSITDGRLVGFMGAGTLAFDYQLGTSALVIGGLPWQLNFTDLQDTTHFSITYYYCTDQLLPIDRIMGFTATNNGAMVYLQWKAPNQAEGTDYRLEYSPDGIHFYMLTTISTSPSAQLLLSLQ